MPCNNSCCLFSTHAVFGRRHHSFWALQQGNKGSERVAGHGTAPPAPGTFFPGAHSVTVSFMSVGFQIRVLSICPLQQSLPVTFWREAQRYSQAWKLLRPGTKGARPQLLPCCPEPTGEGRLDGANLHRGISSICLLTWDVRNVSSPSNCVLARDTGREGHGAGSQVPPGPQKLQGSSCFYHSKQPGSGLQYSQGLLRTGGVSPAILWISIFCFVFLQN